MKNLSVIALAFLVGCGYSEEKFTDDYLDATCTSLETCESDIVAFYTAAGLDEATAQTTYDTVYAICSAEETEDTATTEESESTCEFDSAKAKECIDALEAADCGIWTGEATFPAVCSEVCGAAAE